MYCHSTELEEMAFSGDGQLMSDMKTVPSTTMFGKYPKYVMETTAATKWPNVSLLPIAIRINFQNGIPVSRDAHTFSTIILSSQETCTRAKFIAMPTKKPINAVN